MSPKKYWCNSDTEKQIEEDTNAGHQQIILLNDHSGPNQEINSSVDISDNNIMFYGEVSERNSKLLNKAIRALDTDLQMFKVRYKHAPPPMRLYINSPGGSLLDGFSMMDTVSNTETEIHSYVDGSVASAATLPLVVADKRFMFRNSRVLIHQLSSTVWGKYEDIIGEVENLNSFMSQIKKIYKNHTKMTAKQIEELLKKDKWLSSEECLELGIIDEII